MHVAFSLKWILTAKWLLYSCYNVINLNTVHLFTVDWKQNNTCMWCFSYIQYTNFFTKERFDAKNFTLSSWKHSSMKILYCNVSCDSRPIRCKNHLMQFTFFIFYYSSWQSVEHLHSCKPFCHCMHCTLSPCCFFLSEHWCFCPAWGLGYFGWSVEQVWRYIKQFLWNV